MTNDQGELSFVLFDGTMDVIFNLFLSGLKLYFSFPKLLNNEIKFTLITKFTILLKNLPYLIPLPTPFTVLLSLQASELLVSSSLFN